jgi:hypothetical protein
MNCLDSPSEPARSQNMPFLKMSISQIGLRTPPPSPGDARSSSHPFRFPLPKFLRRTRPARSPTALGQLDSTASRPPPLTFPGTGNTLPRPTSSPFRAVQHMRELVPLVLPASPAPSEHSENEIPIHRKLRKAPLGYRNLRTIDQEQGSSTSARPQALLPSPVFSELQIDQNSSSYVSTDPSNYRQSSPDRPDQASSLYEEHDIVSTYCENHETQTSSPNPKDKSEASPTLPQPAVEGGYDARRHAGIVCAPSSFPRDQRRPLRHRTRSCSSEASWLAGNMSEKIMFEEWLSDLHRSETPNHHQDDEEGHYYEVVSLKRVQMHPSS